MAKYTVIPLTSSYGSVSAINTNLSAISTALENTLSRDGTSPNSLTADLDMNGFSILNIPSLVIGGATLSGAALTQAGVDAASASSSAASALGSQLSAAASEGVVVASEVNVTALEASTLVNSNTASAAAASASASANTALNAPGAAVWVNGNTYAEGDVVWSPIDYITYRCKVAGVSTTDPSADAVNWGITTSASASGVSFVPAGSIVATDVQAAIEELDTEKAPLLNPSLTGVPIAPTAAVGTNTTQLATTAMVQAELDNLEVLVIIPSNSGTIVISAAEHRASSFELTGVLTANQTIVFPDYTKPASFENLTSGAFTTTVKTAGGTGVVVPQSTISMIYANGVNVEYLGSNTALLPASPAMTGTPTAPTAAAGTNTTQLATTANVFASSLGWGQSWQDVSVSRVFGTPYTNTTGKPISVSAGCAGFSAAGWIELVVDGVVVDRTPNVPGVPFAPRVNGIVPNGGVYSLTQGTGVLPIQWQELR